MLMTSQALILLQPSVYPTGIPKARAPATLGPPWNEYDADVLESLDAEGRCVVTDHGAFLLFNIYVGFWFGTGHLISAHGMVGSRAGP